MFELNIDRLGSRGTDSDCDSRTKMVGKLKTIPRIKFVGTDLVRAVYALFCGFIFAFSAAISAFIFLISSASFSSHSASVWA